MVNTWITSSVDTRKTRERERERESKDSYTVELHFRTVSKLLMAVE